MQQITSPSLFRQQAYINGQWVASPDTLQVDNPATGACLGVVPNMGEQATLQAIDAATVALEHWRNVTANERGQRLLLWANLMLENIDDLARIMTLEQGKPLAESAGEIRYAASYLSWFAEEAKRIYGDTIPGLTPSQRIVVTKQPVGVCAAITPWNFPAAMITRKAGAALAAGCTVVAKPSELTPFSALALAELAHQAGIPAGVFNVVTGDAHVIGETLCAHPQVKKLSFTGSTRVGQILYRQCASNIKKLSLELGGNAPFIVFDDADIDKAVEGAIASKYRNAGQTCVCTNRLFVQQGIYTRFCEKLILRMKQTLKVGNGLDETANIGPLINNAAVSKVQSLIDDAVAKGAQLTPLSETKLSGNFVMPAVLTDVTMDANVLSDEIFGPVAPVVCFNDEAEVIALANRTEYGLASYFYARDIARVWRVAEALEYGMVGINTGMISNAAAPFGGVKSSGLGREGSKYGIEDYLEIKYLCMELD